ncbi:putative disease resistance protein RGA1 [Cannabis sativa]|uniref:putative disease resistance protein RGA1 n=1 Tax=Cannabis sativa TaxID=3483 RepID=UPI0029CA8AE4|nr:putative disease resistance protein RGA1 [Cannabis sativa]
MAAGNLSLVVKRVLHLLGPHQQQGLLGGVAKTVSKLAPLLLDAEKKSQRDLCIRYWLTDLEDVLYDVDNLLTEIEIEKKKKKKKKSFPSQVRTSTYSQEIKQVMKRLDGIAIGRKDFDLKKISSEAEAAEEEEEEVHRLRRGESSPTSYLNQEESLVLFEKIAFESKSGGGSMALLQQQQQIIIRRSIGNKIVQRCGGGDSLAIKAIGSMLRSKITVEQLQDFDTEELSKMEEEDCNLHNLFPFTASYSSNEEAGEVLRLLKLCYDDLPSPLKHCFAYCSLFPKRHVIGVQRLIKLWMAQGFIVIEESEEKSMEDVGYQYVVDLIDRYFLEVVERDSKGSKQVTKCKLHNLMYDLAILVTGDQCRLLDSAADTAQCQKNSKTFHACFNFDPSSTEDVTMFDAKKMRTIFLSGQSRRIYRGIGVGKIFEKITYKFRFLLALDMQASGLEIVPNSIGKLKLLKYLDLSENEELTMLPNSITELIDLQTLILSKCFKLEKLPKDFTNLVNLRHFEIDGCNNLANLSPQIKNLSHLKELSQLVLSVESSSSSSRQQHGIKEKKMLPESSELIQQFKIKNLRLKNLRHEETAIQYLRAVPSEIQSLSLEWRVDKWNKSVYGELPLHNNLLSYLEELSINGFKGVIVRCPSSQFSSKLVKLSLSRCSNCKNLQAIHQIHGLKVLVLEYLDNLEYILVGHELFFSSTNNPNLFSSLERLWLTDLPKLQGWCEYNYINVLPSLTKLVIENCPKLSSMPRFPDLKEGLVMDRTSWKLLDMTMNRCTSSSSSSSTTTTAATTSLNPFSNLESICIVDIEDFKDDIPWSTLNKLRFLRFDCIKELDTLPSKLQDVLSLQELQVWRCPIKEIPSWITKFKKLEKLVFGVCPLLKELPENFSRVQIQTLEIKDCNMLLRRLEVGKGADWSKIKFIPEKKLGPISGR